MDVSISIGPFGNEEGELPNTITNTGCTLCPPDHYNAYGSDTTHDLLELQETLA